MGIGLPSTPNADMGQTGLAMTFAQQRLRILALWWQARLDQKHRELFFRWLFVNVIFCAMVAEIVYSLVFVGGWVTAYFVLFSVQVANLVYIRLSPWVFCCTGVLNILSFFTAGAFSVAYALLMVPRDPGRYFQNAMVMFGG